MRKKKEAAKSAAASYKRKKSGKRWLLFLLLLAVLAAAAYYVRKLFFTEEEKIAVTGTTDFGALNEALEGSGTTTPSDSVTYSVNGTVLEWYVEAGQDVQAGDLLYVLDASEVRDEILEYEVELDTLYSNLSDLNESIGNRFVSAPFTGRVENVQAAVGNSVMNGGALAGIVDDSAMTAVLYFSYVYQDFICEGMNATVSVPDQMLTLSGTVTDIAYVDYVTLTGMHCFAVTVRVENPGVLTKGMTVSCWLETEDGVAYAVNDAELDYNASATIKAETSGELSAVNVVNYQRVTEGETLFVIDASNYESQLNTLNKQISSYEEKIADLQASIDTEYTRYADISGRVVTAQYAENRMTGTDFGSVVIYNQDTMEISVKIDELDADLLTVGMDVSVYRTTSSNRELYPATLSYLSQEATSGSSGVSTFAATITIHSDGKLASGVTVSYLIDTTGGSGTEETVLAPLNAICSYDDGSYLIIRRESRPDDAIDPAACGGSVTDFPEGYYAVPVEVGNFNEKYIQIRSGAEPDEVLFLRYRNAAPAGGGTTSEFGGEGEFEMPDFGSMDFGEMPGFSGGGMPGGRDGGMSGGGGGGGFSGGGMPGR